jgi:hypothetical protein
MHPLPDQIPWPNSEVPVLQRSRATTKTFYHSAANPQPKANTKATTKDTKGTRRKSVPLGTGENLRSTRRILQIVIQRPQRNTKEGKSKTSMLIALTTLKIFAAGQGFHDQLSKITNPKGGQSVLPCYLKSCLKSYSGATLRGEFARPWAACQPLGMILEFAFRKWGNYTPSVFKV